MTLLVMMTMVTMMVTVKVIMTILALQLSQEEERGRMEITRMGKVGDDKKNCRDNWIYSWILVRHTVRVLNYEISIF